MSYEAGGAVFLCECPPVCVDVFLYVCMCWGGVQVGRWLENFILLLTFQLSQLKWHDYVQI